MTCKSRAREGLCQPENGVDDEHLGNDAVVLELVKGVPDRIAEVIRNEGLLQSCYRQ